MKVLPKGGEWDQVVLLPFKVYVLTAWPFVHYYLQKTGHYWEPDDVGPFNLLYLFCILVLAVGGIGQLMARKRAAGAVSLAFAGIGWFIWLQLPSGLAK